MNGPVQMRRAVVLGAGMAGLLAARVLSEHAEEVVLIDRDRLPAAGGPRRGVPQGQHVHGLLKRGEMVLEDLFPGIVSTLLDEGAVRVRFGADVRWYHHGYWKLQAGDSVTATFMTRPFLEDEIRRRVLALPRIRTLQGHAALGLTATDDRRRVTGARCQAGVGPERAVDADLVIDATGRASHAPQWLAQLGYREPSFESVEVQVGYASCAFKLPDPGVLRARAMIVVADPRNECARAAAIMPIEGGRWLCSAAGFVGDHPPGDLEGFRGFLAGLPADDLYQVVRDAEPVGKVTTFRFPANRWRHYERMPRQPEGFLVLGDAMASFNPVYGQGMTVAALSANALGDELRGRGTLAGLPMAVRERVTPVIRDVWRMSADEDLGYPGVTGIRPRGDRAVRWYLARVHRATSVDTAVLDHFTKVSHLLESPTALMRPGYVLRVLRAAARAKRAGPTTTSYPDRGPRGASDSSRRLAKAGRSEDEGHQI